MAGLPLIFVTFDRECHVTPRPKILALRRDTAVVTSGENFAMARTASLSGSPWLPEGGWSISMCGHPAPDVQAPQFLLDRGPRMETVGQLLAREDRQRGLRPTGSRTMRTLRQSSTPRAGPALRPHCALRPLRRGKRRLPCLPVPPLPDPEGLARRRPQEGRAREFTQADIDVVGDGDLPFATTSKSRSSSPRRSTPSPSPTSCCGSTTASWPRASTRDRARGHRGVLAASTSSRRSAPRRSPNCSRKSSGPLTTRRGRPEARRHPYTDTSLVEQVRALGVTNELLEEGLTSWSRSSRPPSCALPGAS